MKRTDLDSIDYYDSAVTTMIAEKYGYQPMEAFRQFVTSQTHAMLEDSDFGLTEFGAGALFDMWEAEKITGDPRRSVYIGVVRRCNVCVG